MTHVARRGAVPVLLLAGPLGAGKTTLLNHLLADPDGRRLGVVVNDFGSIGIDALAVSGQVDAAVSLSNGCLCCAIGAEGLDPLLSRLSGPGLGLDGIVVEASGLAEPRELVRQVLSTAAPRVTYGGLVLLVDAEHTEVVGRAGAARFADGLAPGRLRLADLVVVTKPDRVAHDRLADVVDAVRASVPGRPLVTASHGRVDPALLLEAPRRPPAEQRPARPQQLSLGDLRAELDRAEAQAAGHPHPHQGWSAVEFTADRPLDASRLLHLLESRPPGVFRSKGHVTVADGAGVRRFTVHTVGDHLRVEPLRGRDAERAQPATAMVLLGVGLDAAGLRAALNSCVATAPATDAGGALGRLLVLAGLAER